MINYPFDIWYLILNNALIYNERINMSCLLAYFEFIFDSGSDNSFLEISILNKIYSTINLKICIIQFKPY